MGADERWLEISVVVEPEVAEAVSEVFNRLNPSADGRSSAIVEIRGFELGQEQHTLQAVVRTYVPDTPEGRERLRRLEVALGHLNVIRPVPEPHIRLVRAEDWAEAWKRDYKPLRISPRCWVVPSWLSPPPLRPGEVVIRLEPGMAFGTGLHPSTRLATRLLERAEPRGKRVLDVGTGSGILAIAAALLGAREVWATDVDPLAVEVARENVHRNRVERVVRVMEGSLPDRGAPFDVVVVNIIAPVILSLLERGLWNWVGTGGVLLLSGIVLSQEEEVLRAVTRQGGVLADRVQEEDWVGLAFRKKGDE